MFSLLTAMITHIYSMCGYFYFHCSSLSACFYNSLSLLEQHWPDSTKPYFGKMVGNKNLNFENDLKHSVMKIHETKQKLDQTLDTLFVLT